MSKRAVCLALALLLVAIGVAVVVAACGSGTTSDPRDSAAASGSPVPAATGAAFKIGFNEGFTGFMATNAMLIEHGIKTAMAEVDNQWLGHPLVYVKADNASDPVQAVDKARQQVEKDGIQVMIGPEFSPAAQAITQYLATAGGIPQISVFGQPEDNLKTANGLAFMPEGIYGGETFKLGEYAYQQMGVKTVNALCFEDTASRALLQGFVDGFTKSGGTMVSQNFLPPDTIDFSSYLGSMKPADATLIWIYGNGVGPFVKQYRDYDVQAKLITLTASGNMSETVMAELGDAVTGVTGVDTCSPEYDSPENQKFVQEYTQQWDGEYPTADSYGGYIAVKTFLAGLEATNGDATPAKLIPAMAAINITGPSGPLSFTPYKDAFIGTTNLFIVESKAVSGDRIAWVPIQTYENVKLIPGQ
jgi:branched-chain amino acid transport system substrate-binding protein